MMITRFLAASLISLLLTAEPASAAEDFVLPEYGEPITLPGVVPDPVPEALRPAVEAYEAGDYKTARTLFTPAAEEGAPVALYYMGLLHRYGRGGLEVDSGRGYALLERAAEAAAAATPQDGYIYRRSLYSMGYMKYEGDGIERSKTVGECLIRISAEFGYPNAQYKLYRIYLYKENQQVDPTPWLLRSGKQGYVVALHRLGLFLGFHPDEPRWKSLGYLHLAALKGNLRSREILRDASLEDDRLVIADLQKAYKWAENWQAVAEPPPSHLDGMLLRC